MSFFRHNFTSVAAKGYFLQFENDVYYSTNVFIHWDDTDKALYHGWISKELCLQRHNRDILWFRPVEGTVQLGRHNRDASGVCQTGEAKPGQEGQLEGWAKVED